MTVERMRPIKFFENNSTIWILSLLLFLICAGALFIGRYPLSLSQVLEAFFNKLTFQAGDAVTNQVIFAVRLPRILLSAMVGCALGLSGVALQGLFRNPLVDPKVIGVSSGAAFGGTLAIFLGLGSAGLLVSTFFFGMLTLAVVYLVTEKFFPHSLLMLILAGLIVGGLFAAMVSLMQYLSDSEEVLPTIVFWLMGSFASANPEKVLLFLLPFVFSAAVLIGLRWRFNLLSLDEKNAAALGVNVKQMRWIVLSVCGLLVSCQVALSGSIGWVGLIMPHLGRFLVGANHQRLLPAAMLIGGIYMVFVDTLARTLSSAEIPISILTAAIGAPVFALILLKLKKRGWNE